MTFDANHFAPQFAELTTPRGTEAFVALESPRDTSGAQAVRGLLAEYDAFVAQQQFGTETEVLLRFHVSDPREYGLIIRGALAERGEHSFCSIVGQPPVSGNAIALEAYHIRAESPVRKALNGSTLSLSHGAYASIWHRSVSPNGGDCLAETREIFADLTRALEHHGANLAEHVVRTWIYVRNIDHNYKAFVQGRREAFDAVGLTADTHYIASTGIEGNPEDDRHLLSVDALAVAGRRPEQVEYLKALDYLCPTHEYGVTFERGTKVRYGDRCHYYISGTASMTRKGEVLHVGDGVRQAERTIQSVQALLRPHGAGLADLKSAVVYLREPADYPRVKPLLDEMLPAGLPRIAVRGPVCRPAWLFEMEGMAVTSVGDDGFPPFC